MKKNVWSMVLALALVLSLLPVSVLAAESDTAYDIWVDSAAQYHDLVAGEWYHESVNFVLEKGLMNGVGNGKFDPTGTTSRAMLVTILWREAGCPVVNYLLPFEDVPAESWYTEAVRWAASEGIITGYDGLFDSEGAITREQMVTMLYRYARKTQENVPEYPEDSQVLSLVFKDSDSVSTYANAAMQWAYHAGVIGNEGVGNGCLAPRQEMIRAEVAQMLMNYLK